MLHGVDAKTPQRHGAFDCTSAINKISVTGSVEEIGVQGRQSYQIRVLLKNGKEELTLQQTADFDGNGQFNGTSGTSYKVSKNTFAAIKYDGSVERNGTIVPVFVLVFSTRKAFDHFMSSRENMAVASIIERATISNGFESITITAQ